jgi:hypothetical protein
MESLEGVTSAKINFLTEKLTVESDLLEAELIPLLSKAATDFERGVKIEK